MTRFCTVILTSILCSSANGSTPAKGLDLDDILHLANTSNNQRRLIERDYDIAESKSDIIRSEAFPNINFSLTTTKGEASSDLEQAQIKRSSYTDHQFGITAKGPLYAFGRIGTVLEMADTQRSINSVQRLERIQNYLAYVISSYSEALLNLNQHNVASQQLKHAQSLLHFTKIEFDNGARSKIDYLRTKSAHSRAIATLQRTAINAQSSLERLKNTLGLDHSHPFQLKSGEPSQLVFLDIHASQPKRDSTYKNKIAELGLDLSTKLHSYQRAQHFPTLYLSAQVGSQAIDPGQLGSPATSFDDLSDPKRLNYSVSVSLEWNIFSGLRMSSEVAQAYAEKEKARINLIELSREESIHRAESLAKFKASEIILNASIEARNAMELAFNQSELDYHGGTVSLTQMLEVQTDFRDSQKSVSEAYINQIRACTEYRIAHNLSLFEG